jgi:leucyl-tRNA synthetase
VRTASSSASGAWLKRTSPGPAGKLDVASLNDEQKAIRRAIHQAIKQASHDVGQNKFNTAIAQVMTLMNVLEKAPQGTGQDRALVQEGLETVTLLLAPITPHISHELWKQLATPNR